MSQSCWHGGQDRLTPHVLDALDYLFRRAGFVARRIVAHGLSFSNYEAFGTRRRRRSIDGMGASTCSTVPEIRAFLPTRER